LNPTTGQSTPLFNLGTSAVLFEGDIAINPVTGMGYVIEQDSLYSLNLSTGLLSPLGHLNIAGINLGDDANIDALAFRNGTLYGFVTIQTGALNNNLISIDLETLGVTDIGAAFPHRVAFHQTCHSVRMLEIGDRPRRLLGAVAGLELVDIAGADQCCGFGGTFAIKNAETSLAMGGDKLAAVEASGATVLTAADTSCLLHLGGMLSRARSPIQVLHLAEILAAGLPA